MAQVSLTGWQPGFNKIKLNILIQRTTGLSLTEAKQCVDRLLIGDIVDIDISDEDLALEFREEARKLHVNVV